MTKESIYFPPGIWGKITSFLGKDYWYNRKQLSYFSQALDLHNSNYKFSSYWLWNNWRQKKENSWYLNRRLRKPEIPQRFKNYTNNPYITSVDPPNLNHHKYNIGEFYDKHKYYSNQVFSYRILGD